ncbi:MAG: flagellar basal body P-ring formation chaperone FlgA [Planctomycetota bacterium]
MLRTFVVFVIGLVMASQVYCYGEQIDIGKSGTLRIYLPREMVVKSDSIQLGQIGVMQGDEGAVARAMQIGLGRFALTGQQIVIDRRTILSRLASNGIKADGVVLSGAEVVKVRREEKVINGRRFAEVASAFLKTQGGYESVSDIALVRTPKDWVLADDGGEIRLVPRLGEYSRKNKARVWVGVVKDGVEQGGCEVFFDLKYKRRQVVAAVDLVPGVSIGPENVNIETTLSSIPEPAGWSVPYGQIVKVRIKKGSVVAGNKIAPAEVPVVIKRRQTVVMKIETGGLYISAVGVALSDGKVGEYIRVKGPNNSKIIVGKVKADGTVEPVF